MDVQEREYSRAMGLDLSSSHSLTTSPIGPKTLDNLEVGDVLLSASGERTVLAVCGRLVFYSYADQPNSSSMFLTVEELKDKGFKVKSQESNIVEMTLEEVAKLKGVPVENLRIKE